MVGWMVLLVGNPQFYLLWAAQVMNIETPSHCCCTWQSACSSIAAVADMVKTQCLPNSAPSDSSRGSGGRNTAGKRRSW